MFDRWISGQTVLSVLCLLAVCVYSGADKSFEPFSDELLLDAKYDGKSYQTVGFLGRVVSLQTSATVSKAFKCSFTIRKGAQQTTVTFSPDHTVTCGGEVCGWSMFDLGALSSSGFDPNARTIILIPGFLTDSRVDWVEETAQLWVNIEGANVIKVDWTDGNRYRYEMGVSGTPIVAREITILLHHLAQLNGLSFADPEFAKRVQIVGHSLGAHIAGFVGQDFGGLIGRITGLDPAGVFFDWQPRDQRLDSTDARFVDVIHTNGGQFHYHKAIASSLLAGAEWVASKTPLLNKLNSQVKTNLGEGYTREADTSWFGIDQPVGHIDYYANDGRVQPDCDSYLHVCDHSRAHEIYRDFLAHELRMQRTYGRAGLIENRLLAFKSDDYDSFFVGSNLNSLCKPILRDDGKHDGRDARDSTKGCALPLDFTGQVDDLIEEYTNEFGVGSFANAQPPAEYYFSTRGQRPLVGNHLMLRIFPSNLEWDQKCSLKVSMMIRGNEPDTHITMLKDAKKPLSMYGYGGQVFTAIFTMPADNAIERSLLNQTAPINWQSIIRDFLPRWIELSISTAGQSHSTIAAGAKKAWNWFTIKAGVSKCSLDVESVEVVPLISSERAFVGRYQKRRFSKSLTTSEPMRWSQGQVDIV